MAIKVNRKLSPIHEIYITEVVRGLWITAGHFARNMFGHVLGLFGAKYGNATTVTVQYPEARFPISERYRTRHRLLTHADGSPRCVACMCCETICPAHCIYIVAGEYPDRRIEKYPVRFEIDLARCIWCGFCVEACPEDAIRMDTGILETAEYDRSRMFYQKEFLLHGTGRYEQESGARRQTGGDTQ